MDAVKREMKEETGLDIYNPKLVGIKQFPLKDGKYEEGRYIVLLFKADRFSGEVVSSEEGQMEWIDRHSLSETETVEDFEDLLKVMDDPDLTEFQYLVDGDNWTISLK